jgi:methylenetetrahydrofolate dehydrogenase (NADP+) / methenyltetrahydrofolate cyclohydrolase
MSAPTTAKIIDGKAIAQSLRAEIATRVVALKATRGITPGLAVVLVGEDPASQVYVRNKGAQTKEVGMASFEFKRPVTITQAELLAIVADLNGRADVHGILVQLPLPAHIDADAVLRAIDPDKDVDGFHPVNVGRLSIGAPCLVPCTPQGSILLAKSVQSKLAGLEAVVIGRSNIVGKPVAQLLLREDCTVTLAHSRTRNLEAVVRRADLVIAAVGRAGMVRGTWIKPGAIVIDVGINRVPAGEGKTRLVGDVAYDEVAAVAGAITPVPGGVGPMTIACLLKNTVDAAERSSAQPS